jgi:antitoxin MazE
MTTLTKIGNSHGVRIPKPLIQKAHLENVDLEFEVLENGLLIKPINDSGRKKWVKNISEIITKNKGLKDDGLLEDFMNDSDLEDFEW